MELTSSEKSLIKDYIFFHYHSPNNTNPEDYRRFNYQMFHATKLNFLYTISFSSLLYYFLHRSSRAIFKSYVSPGYSFLLLTIYSSYQFLARLNSNIYNEDSLSCAQKYSQSVSDYNDHFRRIYGNK